MKNYARQFIGFQKSTFDNTYDSIIQIQDQAENLTYDMLGKMPWVPEEGKKVLDDSVKMFKNARDDYKKMVNDGFVKMEELFL
jgi:polyhydroxyalkanoate synthesis regulator phasin